MSIPIRNPSVGATSNRRDFARRRVTTHSPVGQGVAQTAETALVAVAGAANELVQVTPMKDRTSIVGTRALALGAGDLGVVAHPHPVAPRLVAVLRVQQAAELFLDASDGAEFVGGVMAAKHAFQPVPSLGGQRVGVAQQQSAVSPDGTPRTWLVSKPTIVVIYGFEASPPTGRGTKPPALSSSGACRFLTGWSGYRRPRAAPPRSYSERFGARRHDTCTQLFSTTESPRRVRKLESLRRVEPSQVTRGRVWCSGSQNADPHRP